MTMDWDRLGQELRDAGVDPEKSSGFDIGRLALIWLFGEANVRSCAEEFIDGGDHSELARSMLLVLKPETSVDYCVRTLEDSSSAASRRQRAARLLCDIGDERIIPRIQNWLNDQDADVQRLSARIVEDLVFKDVISDVGDLLARMANHQNPDVRKHAQDTLRYLSGHP